MVFRLLTTGCCVACVVLLAGRTPAHVVMRVAAPPRTPALRVVDVAARVSPGDVSRLIALADGERIAEVNDRRPDDDVQAAELVEASALHGGYVDLTVVGPGGARRVLVLVH